MPKLERPVTTDVLGEAQTERGTTPFVPMRVESSLVPTDEHRKYIESKKNESKREERKNEQFSITSFTEIK